MAKLKQNPGLTTTKAPFIEDARHHGELFIRQPYELYSEDNQEAWRKLYTLLEPRWEKYANDKFLQGLKKLELDHKQIPRLDEVNKFLKPLTGFQAKAVCGLVPSYIFFDSLTRREFPTTITIRDSQKLSYLSEPDIFHDLAGHVPMHADPVFASVLVKFGSLAKQAAYRHQHLNNSQEKVAKIKSNMQALSRFFWFTIEFGLIRQKHGNRVYGSGIMSSAAEIVHAIDSPDVQRYPLQLEWVINQSYEIDRFQVLLFVIDSFEQLYQEVHELEKWLLSGKLDNVAPGNPKIDEVDLKSFLHI